MYSYLVIKIDGKNIPKFLLKCKKNNIGILSVKIISYKEALIKINSKDYDKLSKIKSIYKLSIINNDGLIKYKELINKNIIFIIMFILGIVFLVFLTNIIFDVDVISDNNLLSKKIEKELIDYDIKKYSIRKDYDYIEKVKMAIKDKYDDNIEWIEIKNIGTKYEVKIVERKKPKINNNKIYHDIVAKKSGVIRRIYAESGEKKVLEDTYVSKGETIISGIILKDEDIKNIVDAKGKVYASVWYNVNVEYPLKYSEKVYTNKKRKNIYIKIGNKYLTKGLYKNFERKKIFYLKDGFSLFEIGIEEERKINIINDKYTYKEAKIKAIEKAKNKILQTLDKDEYIEEQKTLKFYSKDSKIVIDIFFAVYEQIGEKKEIISN